MTNLFKLSLCFFVFITVSCEKSDDISTEIISNDAMELRTELQKEGYTEIIVDTIIKQDCYFQEWDKTVLTPTSGLIEFYQDDTWVASIDFGDGSCDQWATKRWNVSIFPDYPNGEKQFSVFEFDKKEKK